MPKARAKPLFQEDNMDFKKGQIERAAEAISNAKCLTAFTGAGISVESGIPPFRGAGGLWSKYDPRMIEIGFFQENPEQSWAEIKKIFYSSMKSAKPNPAHKTLAAWEQEGLLKGIITQNIDNLHQEAGSKNVFEFHGTVNYLVCTQCGERFFHTDVDLGQDMPACPKCKGLLKPDFVFYGEGINTEIYQGSMQLANKSDVMIVVGTSGEVMPACHMPVIVKQNGGTIIEINTLPSAYTDMISDFYFEMKAGEILPKLAEAVKALLQ